MSGVNSVRETLIAEALGDLGRVIDQAQVLVSTMNESREALLQAHDRLALQALEQQATFERQLGKLSEKAKTQVAAHVVARVEEAYRRKLLEQTREARSAVRALLEAEVEAAKQRLAASSAISAKRDSRVWGSQLAYVAVAFTASALTWFVASCFGTR